MGILESAGQYIGRASTDVARATRLAKVNAQISEMERQRDGSLLRLAKLLYPQLSVSQTFRKDNDALFRCIDDINFQINRLKYERKTLEQAKLYSDVTLGACPKCGAPVAPGDDYCTKCGTKLTGSDAPVHSAASGGCCSKCGAPLDEGMRFCVHCGHEISKDGA